MQCTEGGSTQSDQICVGLLWSVIILFFLTGPFASPLKERFGMRAVVTASGLFAGTAFIVSSFASSLPVMTVILTLFAGEYRPRLKVSEENLD